MKSTGIVRPLDSVGRIVLPMEIRKQLNILSNKDSLEIFTDGDKIILKKYAPNCIFCGGEDGITDFKGKNVCRKCLKEIKKF